MLVEFNVQNVTSFNATQAFSMLGSTSTKEDFVDRNTIGVNKFGVGSILKSAAIFGANASGKSNLIESIMLLKNIVLGSLLTADSDLLAYIPPFLLKEDPFDIPSELEVSFIRADVLYRYGLSFSNDKINEEWLYWNKNIRETKLFHRKGQKISLNNTSFSEAKGFSKENKDGTFHIIKTKSNVPFISVLSQFDGEISSEITGWFKDLKIISGTDDIRLRDYTLKKFEIDEKFKAWALVILKNFQIENVIVEAESDNQDEPNLAKFSNHRVAKIKSVEIVKRISDKLIRKMPIEMESEGTKKVIFTLGPIYDVINNNRVLIVDEFDSKFHTLLSKYLINLFHKNNAGCSQLIISTHDTNLLSREIFRRDQVWFVEKNSSHESKLFSLLEYKEHYTRKSSSYRKDYLEGKYGAIPLFDNQVSLKEALHG